MVVEPGLVVGELVSGVARRTLRTNLRFIGRRVVPQFYPADVPLPRERAKQPYGQAQIVLVRYHARLLTAARFAGNALICGGTDPGRRNITNPLITALDGGTGLPRLDTSRLRATWLADAAELLGLATFMHAAGISCSQRLGDLVAGLGPAWRGRGGETARGGPPAMIPLTVFEEIIDASGVAPRIEAMLPTGVRARQLTVRTLLARMCLTQADGRPT